MESNNDETLNKLYEAMDKKWFTCYLQPKVDLKTDKVVSAESLIRLVHPSYGLISPASIIPVLEKYNLVSVVDYHVLDLVCYTIKNWEERGIKPIPISVNYSRVTLLDNRVVEKTLEIIDKYNIDKSLINVLYYMYYNYEVEPMTLVEFTSFNASSLFSARVKK